MASPPRKSPVPHSAAAASASTTAVIGDSAGAGPQSGTRTFSPRRRAGSRPSRRAGSRGRARAPRRCAPPAGRGVTATAWSSSARDIAASRLAARCLDQAQAEVDVAEEAPLLGLAERRAAAELDRAPDVVEQRRGEEEVVAEARMELRRLAAEGGDADGVLEQAAGVAVVPVCPGGGERAERRSHGRRRRRRPRRRRRGPGWTISPTRKSRKPSSSSGSRRIAGVSSAGSVSGATSTARTCTWSLPPNRSTRPSTRTASPSAKRPSSSSTSSQTRASIRPLASTSSSARYGAPFFVRRRSLRPTAYTPSTVRSSASSAMLVTPAV